MREILFRGKDTETGKWRYSMTISKLCFDDNEIFTYYIGAGYRTIDGKTLGQFTGLTDKNGKKIFEGDILAFSDRLVRVCWHDYCGCWDCSYIKKIEGKSTLHEDRSPNKWRYNAEVIGNIHDNPELLKGGAE